jgi:hypothetical protein
MSSCSHRASADSARQVPFRHQSLVSRSGGLAIVIIREAKGSGELLCDGESMIGIPPARCSAPAGSRVHGEIRAGEWLVDHQSGLVVACPYGGTGSLAFNGRPLRPLSSGGDERARRTTTAEQSVAANRSRQAAAVPHVACRGSCL